jgi:hypothetical protein
MHTVELTDDELRLVREAVRAFLGDFGQEQRELVRSLVAILAKLDASEAAAVASLR